MKGIFILWPYSELTNQFLSTKKMASKGGYREGAGRKSKAQELGLKEKLSPLEPAFLTALSKGVKAGNPVIMKMYAEYFYGKPKDTVEHSGLNGGAILTESKHVVEFINYAGNKTTV